MMLLVTTPEASRESRMEVHKNARLTVHCRELLVERVLLRGEPKVQAARRFAISVKTVEKWLRRYQQEGASGLRDRSCRPRRSPKAIPQSALCPGLP